MTRANVTKGTVMPMLACAAAALAGCESGSGSDGAAAAERAIAVEPASPAPAARPDVREPTAARPAPAPVTLPVEVFADDDGTAIAARRVELVDASGIDALALTCHRCGYRDASSNPSRGAKASVRLNGGPWVDVDDTRAEVAAQEARFGGVAGGYHTVRLTVPITGARDGENTIEFRFNGTDGFSNGFRVLDFNLLENGAKQLLPADFERDDPAGWAPPRAGEADIAAGRTLWRARGALRESALSTRTLMASCADCHTDDGRDLKYFNYSNESIETRARFHGLSAADAERIASYVRTREVPAPARAAPWNPPYQPGPGLDDRPVLEWAAGAGLEWVLEEDADMLPHLFPNGTSPAAVAEVVSTRATLDTREMPISLQLPDWNAWLPEVHPLDVFGDAWLEQRPAAELERVTAALEDGGATNMRTDPSRIAAADFLSDGPEAVQRAIRRFSRVGGPQPCRNAGPHDSEATALLGTGLGGATPTEAQWGSGDPNFCEVPMRSLHHWASVKQWELGQRFALEDAPGDVYPWGEARGWAAGERQVFDLAPHRIGNDSFGFVHLDRRTGSYFNTAWYQLQVILNAGNRRPLNHRPPDWKYQMNHLAESVEESGHAASLRYVQTLIKMWQNLDVRQPVDAPVPAAHFPFQVDPGPTRNGWWLTHVAPWRLLNAGGSFWNRIPAREAIWTDLDGVEPGLRVTIQDALLEAWLDKSETYPISDWPRGDGQDNVNRADYVPTPESAFRIADSATTADGVYRAVPRMRAMGMREDLIERLRAWGEAMWPAGDWEALRAG